MTAPRGPVQRSTIVAPHGAHVTIRLPDPDPEKNTSGVPVVVVEVLRSADGTDEYVQLSSPTHRLAGEAPGLYYLEPPGVPPAD